MSIQSESPLGIEIKNGTNDVITDSDNIPFERSGFATPFKFSWLNVKQILNTFFGNIYAKLASPTFTGTVTTPIIIVSGATANTTPILNASKEIASSLMVDLSATLTVVGWSSFTTKKINKIDCGSYNLWDIFLDGTSNSTTTTIDLVDITNHLSSSNYKAIVVVDNGGAVSATGVSILTNGGSLITFYRNLSQNNFTASGRKLVVVQLIQMK